MSRASCLLGLATSFTIIDSRYEEAGALLAEAMAIQRADPAAGAALSTTLQMHGMVSRFLGRFDEDERAQREAYEILARLHGAQTMSALWQRAVWVIGLVGVTRLDEADRQAQEVLRAARDLVTAKDAYLLWTPLFSATTAACLVGRHAECEALARESIQTLGPAPSPVDARLSAARGFLGMALAAQARCEEARPLIEEALQAQRSRRRNASHTPQLEAALARCSSGR